MKKISPFILIFILNHSLYSQNSVVQVQYESVKGNITNTETLLAFNNKAMFIIDSLLIENKENANIIEEDEYNNRITISQKRIKLDATKYYITKDEAVIYFTQNFKGKAVLVKDSIPEYLWEISNKETKKIGNFICKKATTNFRGSEIIAWYTEEINVPFGPWKFKGLPGLILELYNSNDNTNHIWKVKKVKFLDNKNIDLEKNDKLSIISYEQIIIDMENEIKEQMNRMQTRVPQGVSVSKSVLNRTGIEKKYEWEK